LIIPLLVHFAIMASNDEKENSNLKKDVVTEHCPEIGFSQSIILSEANIYQHQSKYQKIDIHKSRHYGKILVLDDVVQLTENDSNSYNEMLSHVPLMEHPNPKRVLVIGAGDGYVLREVLKHPSVEHVDLVELDADVIAACKLHFPFSNSAWEDPRSEIHIEDGLKYVKDSPSDHYDVVIQDSSDPFTMDEGNEKKILPSSVLYSCDHFIEIYRILKLGGILNFQSETIHIPSDLCGVKEWREQALQVGFTSVKYGSLYITSYITGQIGFLLCKKDDEVSDMKNVIRRFQHFEQHSSLETSYYHPRLQRSCFDLPLWAERAIYGTFVP